MFSGIASYPLTTKRRDAICGRDGFVCHVPRQAYFIIHYPSMEPENGTDETVESIIED